MAKRVSEVLNNIGKGVYDFLVNIGYLGRPIGLVGKNYDLIYRHLSRNIGNNQHEYDGYGTPIGSLADPYFNMRSAPWYLRNHYKNLYSNYLNYIHGVYDSNMKLSPIDGFNMMSLKLEDNRVGVISDFDLNKASSGSIITNPNGKDIDTEMGISNNYYLTETLLNASTENTNRNVGDRNISKNVPKYFGLNFDTEKDNILSRFQINDRVNVDFLDLKSPVYDGSNFGNYQNIGIYYDFLNESSDKTRNFINKSLNGSDLLKDGSVGRNKYYVLPDTFPNSENKTTYLAQIADSVGFETNVSDEDIRYDIKLSSATIGARTLFEYLEQGKDWSYEGRFMSIMPENTGINYGSYREVSSKVDDLLFKTNQNFNEGKYQTLISRFHTSELTDIEESETQSAISVIYGMSKGRNLLKKEPDNSNGYDNPYCRVWTYHHQYATVNDLIRPLSDGNGLVSQETLENKYSWGEFRSTSKKLNKDTGEYYPFFGSGGKRLDKMGVKNGINGLVNITPTKGESGIDVKNCMFSIENLAWKGMFDRDKGEGFENGLSDEQKGPFGGRIMWFPPYDITFNENVGVNWSSTAFIGRGENIYTYVNTERSGNLSFKLLIDHPSILNYWKRKNETDCDGNDVDNIDSKEQEILRFFAGCSILEGNPIPEIEPKPIEPKPEPKPNPIPLEKRTYDKKFTFFVFYPNNYSGVDDKPNTIVSAMEYLANGIGAQMYETDNKTYENLPTTKENYSYNGIVGGYETRGGLGISTVNDEKPYPDRIINTVSANGKPIKIATQLNQKTKKQWYYRVDNRVSHEILQKGNYVDKTSYGLNGAEGYEKLLQVYGGKIKNEELYSFLDVFVALNSDYKTTLDGFYNEEKVAELKDILSSYKIKEVTGMGIASSHGYKQSNNILNKNRAQSVIDWLKTRDAFKQQSDAEYKIKVTDIGNVGKAKSVSDMLPKLYRAAQIEVTYEVEELSDMQATVREEFEETTTRVIDYTQLNSVSGGTRWFSKGYNQFTTVNDRNYSKKDLTVQVSPDIFQVGEPLSDIKNKWMQHEISKLPKEENVTEEEQVNSRYDNEREFFQLLGKEAPFMHNLISEKIKYFDPAFHSSTPEGFNARLNFLHQCTRQGSTVGASDINNKSRNANNLAFGRPPICILRIGDMYYTKIIIESLNITYDPLVWDLNTEGIGVQPMIANVDISFKFLGGSDLAGPISRLQNALSFNYYANTGVYDNRAEMVEYSEDGLKINRFKAFK